MKKLCAVIGNPVQHSRSPEIHQHFAQQFNLDLDYQKLASNETNFKKDVKRFFATGGVGLNVTLPFKFNAFQLADELTKEAQLAQSVNTLYRNASGQLCGDTTDGRGLLNDLLRIKIIQPDQHVLLLGAGGAARSIIPTLLKFGCQVSLINRTPKNAEQLIDEFSHLGTIRLFAPQLDRVEVIINTLPQDGELWLQQFKVTELNNTHVYDISYGERAQTFLKWCKAHQCLSCTDGWGMLVEQAALSFELWHQRRPVTDKLYD